MPYHMRDEPSRKRSTREHIRSLPAYQLSRIEDKRHRLSIASSSSSSSSSQANVVDSSSLESRRLDKSASRDELSSEEERNLSQLADTVDKCVAGIVDRVESELSLSRVGRVGHVHRVHGSCSTLRDRASLQLTAGPSAPAGEHDTLVVARVARAPTDTPEAKEHQNSTSSSHIELIRVPTQSSTVSSWSSRFALPPPLCATRPSTTVSSTAPTVYSNLSGNDVDNCSEGTLQYLELYSPTPRPERDSVSSGRQESAVCTEIGSVLRSEVTERPYVQSDEASMAFSSRSSSSNHINTVTRGCFRDLSGVNDDSRVARPRSWATSVDAPAFTKPFDLSQSSSGVPSSWSSPSIASSRSTSSLCLALSSTAGQWNSRQLQMNRRS